MLCSFLMQNHPVCDLICKPSLMSSSLQNHNLQEHFRLTFAEYLLMLPSGNSTSYINVFSIGFLCVLPIIFPCSSTDRRRTLAMSSSSPCGRSTSLLISVSVNDFSELAVLYCQHGQLMVLQESGLPEHQ